MTDSEFVLYFNQGAYHAYEGMKEVGLLNVSKIANKLRISNTTPYALGYIALYDAIVTEHDSAYMSFLGDTK